MQIFSTTAVRKILGIKYPRLREWIDRGYVTPTLLPEGPGSRTGFSLDDIYHAKIFMYLLDMGYGRTEAAIRVTEISLYARSRQYYAEKAGKTWPRADFAVLIRRAGIKKLKGALLDRKMFEEKPLADIMRGDDFTDAVLINLAKLRRDVDEDIKRL